MYLNDAKILRGRYPNVSIGIHWTLSAGRPVSENNKVRSLINDSGYFWSYNEFRHRYNKGLIEEKEIRCEPLEQFDRFCLVCGKPDYWNTHQNVHVGFKIFNIFL